MAWPEKSRFPNRTHRPGYWGRNPHKLVEGYEVPSGVRVLLQDQLITRGQRMRLWLPLSAGTLCSCRKDTRDSSAERDCLSCYGVGYVGGYNLFMHETLHFASSAAIWTHTNTRINTERKPHRIELVEGQLTGTAISSAQAYTSVLSDQTTPLGVVWESQAIDYAPAGTSVLVEWSNNAGVTWRALSALSGADRPAPPSGNMLIRVTLTRATVDLMSPEFEIVRLRRPQPERVNIAILQQRPDFVSGEILALRTQYIESTVQTMMQAQNTNWQGDAGWTAPLDFFDMSLTRDTPACRVHDRNPGPHAFLQHSLGIETDERHVVTQISLSEQLGMFTHQALVWRLAQHGEIYHSVW